MTWGWHAYLLHRYARNPRQPKSRKQRPREPQPFQVRKENQSATFEPRRKSFSNTPFAQHPSTACTNASNSSHSWCGSEPVSDNVSVSETISVPERALGMGDLMDDLGLELEKLKWPEDEGDAPEIQQEPTSEDKAENGIQAPGANMAASLQAFALNWTSPLGSPESSPTQKR